MKDTLLAIPITYGERIEIYSGAARRSGKIWAREVRPERERGGTVFLIVHPTSNFLGHYALEALAELDVAAVGLTTRYLGNDSTLTLENCVLDVGRAIAHLRESGYDRVVLVGNSGGGGLSALYQSQAEHPSIRSTPAGDPLDLTTASLPPADGLVMLMAHPGRAQVYTEWLDPAIIDEQNPNVRARELDLFAPENAAPFSPEFVARYREAQLARSSRIREWVMGQLTSRYDRPFIVHGTCADPRFIDMSLDPSDREPGTLWGEASEANFAPSSLGRYTSLRSWLSQWSIADSRGHGPSRLADVSVPVQVVFGTADKAAFPSHAYSLFNAVRHNRKALVELKGADHYFIDQPGLIRECAAEMVAWAQTEQLL